MDDTARELTRGDEIVDRRGQRLRHERLGQDLHGVRPDVLDAASAVAFSPGSAIRHRVPFACRAQRIEPTSGPWPAVSGLPDKSWRNAPDHVLCCAAVSIFSTHVRYRRIAYGAVTETIREAL